MPIEITMPRLSDTMEEGTLIKWRVKEGDAVKSGDVLADVETDKATMELQAFDDGKIAKIVAPEGETLPVGGLICVLAEEGENVDEVAKSAGSGASSTKKAQGESKAASSESSTATAVAEPPPPEVSPGAPTAKTTSSGNIKVSPVARKIAEERGVDISRIHGTGPDGRIIKRDVLAAGEVPAPGSSNGNFTKTQSSSAAPKPTPVKLESKLIPVTNMRKTIARRLLESKTTIPHFTVTVNVNADPLLELRSIINKQLESQGVKLSVNDFVVRAAAMSLVHHPLCNTSWTDHGIQQHGTVNVGVAVALPAEKGGGLVVPVLHDTQNVSLRDISAETKRLAKKARETGLTADEMSGGTFTISNLGMFGVDHFEAIINPPQAAILAVGGANEKPVVRNGQVVVGHEMACTLSADHRVIDGAMAAELLQTLKELLENPAAMVV